MIYIFSPDATPTELLTNGYGILECSSCSVYEELNGEFSCFVSIPLDTKNEEYFVGDAIVKVPTHRGVQYFRLQVPETQLTGKTATGYHISYDMSNDLILNGYVAAESGDTALNYILNSGTYETRFSGTSDIATINNARIVRTPLLSALMDGGRANSFVSRWGGEIERDNFTFNINARLGADNGARVSYKKNLSGLRITEDYTKIATRIYPTCLQANDTVLIYPGSGYIDSPELSTYPMPKIKHIHYSDIKVGAEVDGSILYPDEASAIAEMLARVQAMYAAGQDKPQVTVEASVANLPEYAELNLGDTVKGGFRDWVFNHRVVSVNYDGLYDRMISVTLGAVKSSFQGTMYAQTAQVQAISDSLEGVVFQGEKYNEVYIDHTDGFVAECASLNSKAVLNGSKIGFYDMDTNEFIGGLASVDGLVALIARILADKENPNFYATIGDRLDGSIHWRGIYGYYWREDRYLPAFALEHMDDSLSILTAQIILTFQDSRKFYFDIEKDMWIGMHTGESGEGNYGGIMLTNYEGDGPHGFIEVESGSDIFAIGADADGPYVDYRIGGGARKRTTIPGMQFGTESIGSAAWTSVSYPMAYPAGGNYKVFVTPVTEASGVVAIKIRNESNTGFDMIVGGSGFPNIPVNWMAVYYP